MTNNVAGFKGVSRDHRRLLHCPECEAATFKIVKRGASEVPIVECSNCECKMEGVNVDV